MLTTTVFYPTWPVSRLVFLLSSIRGVHNQFTRTHVCLFGFRHFLEFLHVALICTVLGVSGENMSVSCRICPGLREWNYHGLALSDGMMEAMYR